MVMSARPGTLTADVQVPFPHPRPPQLRTSAEFNELAETVSQHLLSAYTR